MSNPQSNEIKFYHSWQPYYEFTNFWPVSFNISQIPQNLSLSSHLIGDWKTSEHLFQAAKFIDCEIIKEIREAPDTGFRQPGGVFFLANSGNGVYRERIRPDWHSISAEVMCWVVKEKFMQNETLKNKLLGTGKKQIIEDSPDDYFWGVGANGKGKNELGKILMEIRNELAQNQSPNPTPPTPPKSPPVDPSQPTAPDNNPNSPDHNNNENDNSKSPSPNQKEENNSPTNNDKPSSVNNNDNSNKEKNDDSPSKNPDSPQHSESTTEIPPINTDRINNAETPEQSRQEAQQQIQKLFAKSKVRSSDLEPSLWKGKGSWEEYLKELKNNQEILEFTQLLASKIKEQQQANQNKKSNSSPNSNSPNKNKLLVWSVGSGILLAILVFSALVFRQKVIRKRKSKRVK